MWRSRLGWAGLVSLLLHAMLLAWLWRGAPERPFSEPERSSAPVVVEILSPATPEPPKPEPAQPTPEPEPPPVTPRPTPERKPPPARPQPAPEPEAPPAAASHEAPTETPSPGGSEQADAPTRNEPPADVPRAEPARPSLIPTAPNGGWSLPSAPEGPRGHTLRPGDPSLSPKALAAEEHARVDGRLKEFVDDEIGRIRVENGVVHPYFGKLRAALEKELEGAPVFGSPSTLHHLARRYREEARRYGATGSPSGRVQPVPSVSERLGGLVGSEPGYEGLRARTQAGEQLQQIADGQRETALIVTVELTQGPDGKLLSARVVRTSGNKAYDAYVMERVPTALAPLAPPPAGAPGIRPEGIRSLWEVEGRTVYRKKLRDMEGKDAWYTAAMAAAGVLSGSFEETTGDVYVIDLRNPRFVIHPRLIRVY